MDNSKFSTNISARIEQWWADLHKERKCNSTSLISKAVNKASSQEQNEIRELISHYIKNSISNALKSTDLMKLSTLCYAINGCFDNFTHAADGVNLTFNEVVTFIDFCINQCSDAIFFKETSKFNILKALDLIHCLSRITVLVLKLRRPQTYRHRNILLPETDFNVRLLLSQLSYKTSRFLTVDEILMDTKCNFIMSSLLMREILFETHELIEFHKKFLTTLPVILMEKEYKLNILKFLLGNAVINTWSNFVVDINSVGAYLQFFVHLCENYSSDTTVILNLSRALLLLVKNECFNDFVLNHLIQDSQKIISFLSCIWMLLDHPVACVRHSSKDFLPILARYEKFRCTMLNSLPSLSCETRSYFTTLAALANEAGSRCVLQIDRNLPKNVLLAMYDPTLVTHVIFALENLIVKDILIHQNNSEWCETWIVPLLMSLSKVPLVVAADTEKLLHQIFKQYPSGIVYIINKWSDPKNDEELRYLITALKIYHKHGFKFQNNLECGKNEKAKIQTTPEVNKKWKGFISEKLLLFCLHHNDDDIRVSAFSLIIQGLKSTEIYTEQDFRLIQYFLIYNMNNQHPATRQKALSLFNKMLARYAVSLCVIKRNQKILNPTYISSDYTNYQHFKEWLIKFCFHNIFDGANFNRLNTVLSILLLCFEYFEDLNIEKTCINLYWQKILVGLRSSYEENKIMGVTLTKKLKISELIDEPNPTIDTLFKRGYELCGKMEPPNVLTGAYLIQMLIEFSSFNQAAEQFATTVGSDVDPKLLCVCILADRLEEQVEFAEQNLIKAAVMGPMYGILFTIRLIIQKVNFLEIDVGKTSANVPDESRIASENTMKHWSTVINKLIKLSFRMIHVVGCIVNSSSPEGHLPSDFQSDHEFFLSGDCMKTLSNDLCEKEESSLPESELESLDKRMEKIKLNNGETFRSEEIVVDDCERLIRYFNRLSLALGGTSSFSERIILDLNDLLQDNARLISEINCISLKEGNYTYLLQCLHSVDEKLLRCLKSQEYNNSGSTKPTAQILLLCAWRSIKEACLFLGDLVSKLPLEEHFELKLLTEETVLIIGQELRTLLCEIRHRGAFEQAYIGFNQLIAALWKCPRKNLSELPCKWLQEILDEIILPLDKQKMKLCSNRRSAGLPFLVQGIISSELKCSNFAKIQTLDTTMTTLLDIVESEKDSVSLDCKVHSLNILRALFKHAMLGEHVSSYVARALTVAIRGSRATAWSIRNSCNLLFSSLVIRIFGVARNKDTLSKKNRMTSRTFFLRYPELLDFFISEMKSAFFHDHLGNQYHPQPNIFHILLILGRLYPSPTEDSKHIDFSELLSLVNISCRNPTLKIRECGARAMIALFSQENFKSELNNLFSSLYVSDAAADRNELHGILLQVKAILNEVVCSQSKLIKEPVEDSERLWIENTAWILNQEIKMKRTIPYFLRITYIQVLHIVFKNYPSLRTVIEKVINKEEILYNSKQLSTSEKSTPGHSLYLEVLYFLKLDIAAHNCLETGKSEEMVHLIRSMLDCKVDEVQAIPLRLFMCFASKDPEESNEDDDVNAIAAHIKDLSCITNEKAFNALKNYIFSSHSLINHAVKHVTEFLLKKDYSSLVFEHKVVTRLWISVISTFMLKSIISVNDIYSVCIDDGSASAFFESIMRLIDSDDPDISVGAFICYSVFFFERISNQKAYLIRNSISSCIKMFFSFSDPEADVKQRHAVCEIFNKYCDLINHSFFIEDNQALSIWLLPVRLIADDDSAVRKSALRLVDKYQLYLRENFAQESLVIKFDDFSLLHLTAVPPRSQEYLLDCYINLFGEKHLLHLLVQMTAWCLSAYIKAINYEHTTKQNEDGVFEKGNPNPFCEELAIGYLIRDKIEQLKSLVDVKSLMTRKLESTHINFLQDFFPTLTLPYFPTSLNELVIQLVNIIGEKDPEPENRVASLLPLYIDDLKKLMVL